MYLLNNFFCYFNITDHPENNLLLIHITFIEGPAYILPCSAANARYSDGAVGF